MDNHIDYAFPAGDESDPSGDEWDAGHWDEKVSSSKDLNQVHYAEDDVSKLKIAISKGDLGAIEELLDNGLDVETKLGFGWTPLMCAVSEADHDLAKVLLERGASANFSKDLWTVLMVSTTASASEDKIARCVELLLSRNADPNVLNSSQMTCLMLAARGGHSKVLNLLVSYGAEVNVQDRIGYTALSIAVQVGKEQAVLKLLQLGADKTIKTKDGKSPADLAIIFKRAQISRILASSSHISTMEPFSSMEETLLKTISDQPASKENVTKLDELELFLHGLDLGHIADIMAENDITWGYMLTMEKEDMEKIGITDPVDQQKVLSAVQQIHLDKVDLDTVSQLGGAESGSEELHNFLISVSQQCCYLTETIQDVISRFPRQASQLVFYLDPKKESEVVCNQLVLQTKDLQKEVSCLRNLLCQLNEAGDCCQPPQPDSHSSWRTRALTRATLSLLGASFLLVLCRVVIGRV